ncbi:hypothetical protein niasHT_025175 [Heterodera trifolii]|uniref:Ubiquitin-like domain-containing protein n=1 Tax=Heterodera trifolii TaxID=157864 RepID=A0ABD2JLB7_9BILA
MLMMNILFSFTDGMQIQVISDRQLGVKLTISVHKTDTVATLKTKITKELKEILQNQTGIPAEEQSLRYTENLMEILKKQTDHKKQTDISSPEEQSLAYYKEGNGLILEDSKTLEEYGIKNDVETIYLELIGFEIFIEHKGTRHSFSLLADDFVKSLKEKIKDKLRIPCEQQIITCPDGHVLWEEFSKMYYHNIVNGICLSLNVIEVQYNGNSYAIEVKGTEKVADLKKKVTKKINESIPKEENIKIKRLTLKDQQDKILEDDTKTIAYYKIQGPLTVKNAKIKEKEDIGDKIVNILHHHS